MKINIYFVCLSQTHHLIYLHSPINSVQGAINSALVDKLKVDMRLIGAGSVKIAQLVYILKPVFIYSLQV